MALYYIIVIYCDTSSIALSALAVKDLFCFHMDFRIVLSSSVCEEHSKMMYAYENSIPLITKKKKSVILVTFCFCDRIPWARQLIEKVYLGLQFQRVVHNGTGGMVAFNQSRKLRAPSSTINTELGQRELEGRAGYELTKPAPANSSSKATLPKPTKTVPQTWKDGMGRGSLSQPTTCVVNLNAWKLMEYMDSRSSAAKIRIRFDGVPRNSPSR